MNRRALTLYVGPLWRQPTEAEWEDLEDRIERDVRRAVPHAPDDRTLMGSGPAKKVVMEWRRNHKLLDTDDPSHRAR